MSLEPLKRAGALVSASVAFVLTACGADRVTEPTAATFAAQGIAVCTPGADHATLGAGLVPDPVLAARCAAQPGDLIDVSLQELHPTQPSLGYDEVYYKLGRYALGKDTYNKRFGDWCEANGQGDVASATASSTLHDPTTFTCTIPLGAETQASKDAMKTVVIGPRAQLYLTDGHHTFTSFWETPDGGPTLHVRVRVEGNLSTLSTAAFWQAMRQNQWVWLRNANEKPIFPQQLPRSLGLSQFGNDPYRGVLYFARDVGYVQLAGNAIFQEFYWGRWLRRQTDPALDLTGYDLDNLASYLALVKAISQAQASLGDNAIVSDGKTALELGKLALWNNGAAESSGEFAKLTKPYSDAKPGKLAYALAYKAAILQIAAQ